MTMPLPVQEKLTNLRINRSRRRAEATDASRFTQALNADLVAAALARCLLDAPAALLEPAHFHFNKPGKLLRGHLAYSSALAMDLNEVHAIAWAVSVELLHNASLVHDDICDRDSNRRDQESVFRRFGPAVALCLGDFLIGKAYAIAAESDPRLTFVISQAISMLAGGQAAEFTRRGYPGLAEYKKIAIEKTAPMLGMPVLGNLVLSQQEHARRAVEHYFEQAALCYQIINDLNNFSGDDGANSPCSDLSLCRPNAVLACFRDSLHVNAQSRFDFWAEAVRAGKLGADAVETIEWSQQVKESTAFSTTFELLDGHFSEAERALATLQPCLQLALQPIHQWLRQHALRIDTAAFRPR